LQNFWLRTFADAILKTVEGVGHFLPATHADHLASIIVIAGHLATHPTTMRN